jgi:hypothetical protein
MWKAHFTVRGRGGRVGSVEEESEMQKSASRAAMTSAAARPNGIARWTAHAITIFTAAVFLDSLRFKFTNAPKTQIIFGDLDAWAAGFGAPGLFAQTGLFSQHVIGVAELFAAFILIGSMVARRYRFLQPAGAVLAIAIMSGAVSFHLFTPLGVNVDGDGGSLFYTACAVWIGSWVLLWLRRRELGELLRRLRVFFAPQA